MPELNNIENSISIFIEQQFPGVYRDDAPLLTLFLKAYYEHLEQNNNTLQISRNMLEYIDVDQSVGDFLKHFKETYLFSLPDVSNLDVGFVTKHILDLYRSKGSETCVKLLFKLVYGKDADLYIPNVHILRPSDAEFVKPRYVECYIPDEDVLKTFLGRTITGETSKASAYVTSIVGTSVQGTLLTIMFLDNLVGEFQGNELISNGQSGSQKIRLNGSLNNLTIAAGGNNYAVGDTLDVKSTANTSTHGHVRVLSVKDGTGIPNFITTSVGSGYSTNTSISNVLVSTVTLEVNNVSNTFVSAQFDDLVTSHPLTTRPANTFDLFETIESPRITIEYTAASDDFYNAANTSTWVVGLNANGVVVANGNIGLISGNTSEGSLFVYETTGSFSSSVVNLQIIANTYANATPVSITNTYAYGTYIGDNGKNIGLVANNIAFPFADAQMYVRGLTSNTYADIITNVSGTGSNIEITTILNGVTANVYTDYINANNAGNVAFLDMVIDGSTSNVSDNGYGFVKNTSANVDSVIEKALTFQNELLGEISILTINDTGNTYSGNPVVLPQNRYIDGYNVRDVEVDYINLAGPAPIQGDILRQSRSSDVKVITFSSAVNPLAIGEGIVQEKSSTVNNYAVVLDSNTTYLKLGNLVEKTDGDNFYVTGSSVTFSSNTITGFISGNTVVCSLIDTQTNSTQTHLAVGKVLTINTSSQSLTARMHSVDELFRISTTDRLQTNNNYKSLEPTRVNYPANSWNETIRTGLNATISSNVTIGTGIIDTIEVVDSGYRFKTGENVSFTVNGITQLVTGTAVANGTGISRGYWRRKYGALNENYFIHDNDFYQTFSYQILSEFELNKYEKVVKDVIHTAGYKLFGKVVVDSFANNESSAIESSVVQA